jgi:pseudouridylate synthase
LEQHLSIREDVAAALAAGESVVALESTVIAHGLPRPQNLETAHKMEADVRDSGAIPATIGLLDRKLVVGLSAEQISHLSAAPEVAKVSRSDLAAVLASRKPGATTVAATAFIAHLAGISLFATGGIGGVHRGAENTFDVSADLTELGRTPVAVVCAGAKAILDLPRTLEVLETLGVPVVGYRTSEFPAFYSRESGLQLLHQVNSPEEAAELLSIQWGSPKTRDKAVQRAGTTGVIFANPAPERTALPRAEVEGMIKTAMRSAEASGIHGKSVTPYLLQELARLSGGKTLAANIDLLVANATLAGRIAVAYAALTGKAASRAR